MKLLSLVLGTCLLAPTVFGATAVCPAAKHAKIPKVKAVGFEKARDSLLKAGWKPIIGVKNEESLALDKELFEKGYTEVQSCAGTGLSPCSFMYQDKFGNKLRLVTLGEDLAAMKGDNAKIVCE